MSRPVVGIDLGTTFTAVAKLEAGRPVVVRNGEGKATTPSVIYFTAGGGKPLIGGPAKLMQEAGEREVACFFKRRMGYPDWRASYLGWEYAARDLSAILLRQVLAETVGTAQVRAVITVPAYFVDRGRTDTIQAGEAAGIEVLGIVNEPTAAALAFGVRGDGGRKTALVYDLGGGTFDVTIVRFEKNEVQVLGSDGDHELGGKDWDDRLLGYVTSQFRDEHGLDARENPLACLSLGVACETAKQQLSARPKTTIPFALEGRQVKCEVTRDAFEALTRDLVERTFARTERALADVKLRWRDIDVVVPVGGSTRMPMILQAIRERFQGPLASGVDPDEAVALGAALEAERRTARDGRMGLAGPISVRDVMAHSLGMVSENTDRSRLINSVIIPKNTPIPCRKVRLFQQRTRRSGATETEVYVVQGEAEAPLDCTLLGKYVIGGIQPEPGGTAVLEICYQYDENGVVQVSAIQQSSRAELTVRMETLPADVSWMGRPPTELDVPVEPLSVFLAIDLSGSMSGSPLEAAQEAARGFVRRLDFSSASMGLNIFADQSSVTVELCASASQLLAGIDAWEIGPMGYGNSGHPFHDLLPRLRKVTGRRFVVLLTDGQWNDDCAEDAQRTARELKAEGVEIVATGFGGADEDFLRDLATSEEGALLMDQSQLAAQLSRIAQVISDAPGGLASGPDPARKGLFGIFSGGNG